MSNTYLMFRSVNVFSSFISAFPTDLDNRGTYLHFIFCIIPPTLKKLKGYIALGLSVILSVRPSIRLCIHYKK